VTRYATVRLVTAGLFAVFVIGAITASAHAEGDLGIGSVVLAVLLGLVSFALVALVLLFDAGRRHQLRRVLAWFVASSRLGRIRRSAHDAVQSDEEREEMRRRLAYALEGLRTVSDTGLAVNGGPVPAGATLLDDGPLRAEAAEERPQRSAVLVRSTEIRGVTPRQLAPRRSPLRLPASARVAHGSPLVRVSVSRYRCSLGVAATRTSLSGFRQAEDLAASRAAGLRWSIRAVVLLVVPAAVIYRLAAGTARLDGVWDSIPSRIGLLAALALGAVGMIWAFYVTAPERSTRAGSSTKSESHVMRSLLASEQLAMRMAAGVTGPDAWQTVALRNHFPPGAEQPAADVDGALGLVERLRLDARRRRFRPMRQRLATVVRPLLACLLPASVILLRL
jgi:hypothetical protein